MTDPLRDFLPLADATARRYAPHPAEREELAADLRLVLWRAWLTYDPAKGKLRTWLIGQMRWAAKEWQRVTARRRGQAERAGYRDRTPLDAPLYWDSEGTPDTLADTLPDPRPGPEEVTVAAEWARSLLPLLSDRQQEAARLVWAEGLTYLEAATLLGISETGVGERIRRAARVLRAYLETLDERDRAILLLLGEYPYASDVMREAGCCRQTVSRVLERARAALGAGSEG
jgi:RNA polymerase sigma factor (sigma-70 family)